MSDTTLDVFLNADLTHTRAVGESLRLGLEAGLAVGAERYGGPPIAVLVRDHRNNMRRTASLITEAAGHASTLAVVGGMHTPHYLKHGPTINAYGLVLLLPWSAGAALTRLVEGDQNHIFRLSVDDRKAAAFLAEQAAGIGCQSVTTLALDNGWGRGNARALKAQIPKHGATLVDQRFLRHDAGEETVAAEVAAIAPSKPDCVIFVLAGRVSALVANALATWDTPPEILSHWGILGGGFEDAAAPEVSSRLNIAVLSTCVLNIARLRTARVAEALAAAGRIHPGVTSLYDLPSPMAFAHAYDIGLLLRAAVPQAQHDPRWSTDRHGRSAALRDALEALHTPVDGLLKEYVRPYTSTGPATPDGHEALGQDDLCLTSTRERGLLKAFDWEPRP